MADPVKQIYDENRVSLEEALFYLEGFGWDLDSAMDACGNKTLLPLTVRSSSKQQQIEEVEIIVQQPQDTPQETGNREVEIIVQQPQDTPQETGNRSRWPVYVKRCNDMIAFLTAATLAFLPIRYIIDARKKSGVRFHIPNLLETLLKFFEDFDIYSVDPFLCFALAYAAFYILASSSSPRFVVRVADVISIVFGFCLVFSVIFFISPSTCFLGAAAFGLCIGALTIRECLLSH